MSDWKAKGIAVWECEDTGLPTVSKAAEAGAVDPVPETD